MLRKLPVKEIMSKTPVVIRQSSSVSKAAKMMKKNNVGSLIVVDRKHPKGIVTERDILLKVIARDINPAKINVKKIMSSPVVTISPNAPKRPRRWRS
jgi:CBS domain-containing protein